MPGSPSPSTDPGLDITDGRNNAEVRGRNSLEMIEKPERYSSVFGVAQKIESSDQVEETLHTNDCHENVGLVRYPPSISMHLYCLTDLLTGVVGRSK